MTQLVGGFEWMHGVGDGPLDIDGPLPTVEPTPEPTATPIPEPTPVPTVAPYYPQPPVKGTVMTLAELDAAGAAAGWSGEPWYWMRRIISECENRALDPNAHNSSDPNSGSFGLAQLNGRQHFDNAGEDFAMRFDPVVNLRTALWLYNVRGRFGGTGGWYACSIQVGAY